MYFGTWKAKVKMFGHHVQLHTWNISAETRHRSCPVCFCRWSFGPVVQSQDQGTFQSWCPSWIILYTNVFQTQILGQFSTAKAWSCTRTMIWCPSVNLQQNRYKGSHTAWFWAVKDKRSPLWKILGALQLKSAYNVTGLTITVILVLQSNSTWYIFLTLWRILQLHLITKQQQQQRSYKAKNGLFSHIHQIFFSFNINLLSAAAWQHVSRNFILEESFSCSHTMIEWLLTADRLLFSHWPISKLCDCQTGLLSHQKVPSWAEPALYKRTEW